MAKIFADRVLELTTTTGTGALTLGGAMTGFQGFADVCDDADVVDYSAFAVDGDGVPSGDWETGRGIYHAGGTLERSQVQASSSGGALVNFAAGDKHVQLSANAQTVAGLVTESSGSGDPFPSARQWKMRDVYAQSGGGGQPAFGTVKIYNEHDEQIHPTAYAASSTNGSQGVANAFDDDANSIWSAGPAGAAWLTFEFATTVQISKLVIYSRGDGVEGTNVNYFILQKADEVTGTTYVDVQVCTYAAFTGAGQTRTVNLPGTAPGASGTIPAGGADGQILAKASGLDYDVEWVNPPSGGGGATPSTLIGAAEWRMRVLSYDTGQPFWGFAETQWIDSDGVNVARNAGTTYNASSYYDAGRGPAQAFDDNLTQDYQSGSFLSDSFAVGNTLGFVCTGDVKPVTLVVYGLNGHPSWSQITVQIEAKIGGVWTSVGDPVALTSLTGGGVGQNFTIQTEQGGASAITQIGKQIITSSTWGGNTSTAGAPIPGSDFDFTVPVDGIFQVRYYIRYQNSHRVRGNIYLDGARFMPGDNNSADRFDFYSYSMGEQGWFLLVMESMGPIAAGDHTIEAYYNAMDSTAPGGTAQSSFVTITRMPSAF